MTTSNRARASRGVPLGYVLAAVFGVQALIVAAALVVCAPGWL